MRRAGVCSFLLLVICLISTVVVQAQSQGVARGTPKIVFQLVLLGQAASTAQTTLFTPDADGLYRFSNYVMPTVFDPVCVGAINSNLFYMDEGGGPKGVDLAVTSTESQWQWGQSVVVLRVKGQSPVTYQINLGQGTNNCRPNAQFNYYLTVERIQ